MPNTKTFLHQVEKRISPQKYITRYHNTTPDALKSIMNSGLDSRATYSDAIFTSSNPKDWSGARRPIQLKLKIPKDYYLSHQVENPDYPEEEALRLASYEGTTPWNYLTKLSR